MAAAYGLLFRKGFARVSVDMIAAEAGVTKRTLYYHFDSKDALAAAALDVQHALILQEMRGWGLASAGSPAELIAILFQRLRDWAAQAGWTGSGFTRLTMELSDLPGHPARAAASRHKGEVERLLAGELGRFEPRAADTQARRLLLLLEGAMSLALIRGDLAYIEEARAAALELAA